MIQKPMLRVEGSMHALCEGHNAKKQCVPCVFALLKQIHGRVLWGCGVDGFLFVALLSGVEKNGKTCKAPRNHEVRGQNQAGGSCPRGGNCS